MTLHETKIDIMQRGFILGERLIQQAEGTIVQLIICKIDTDNLKVEATPGLYFDGYLNEEFYTQILKQSIVTIDKFITKRHAQNPNTCHHEKTPLDGGLIGCFHCMAKLGTTARVKNDFTINLDNN